jgi:hypothetical protein
MQGCGFKRRENAPPEHAHEDSPVAQAGQLFRFCRRRLLRQALFALHTLRVLVWWLLLLPRVALLRLLRPRRWRCCRSDIRIACAGDRQPRRWRRFSRLHSSVLDSCLVLCGMQSGA